MKPTTKEIIVRFLPVPVLFALLVFLPAGTVNYWQAWVSLTVFLLCTVALTVWLMKYDPALLERRMHVGPTAEPRFAQRVIVTLLLGGYALSYVLSAVDYRFGWSTVSAPLVVAGNVAMVVSYWVFYLVMKANSYAAATIRVESEQHVISSGPYAVVRHPMYSGALLMMLAIPLSLASYWGMLAAVVALPVLHLRIVDEEKLLVAELLGYDAYREKVRYRLIPGVY